MNKVNKLPRQLSIGICIFWSLVAGGTITVPSHITVSNQNVYLADIFPQAQPGVALMTLQLGQKATIPHRQLLRLAKQYKIDWIPDVPHDIVIEHPVHIFEKEDVLTMIKTAYPELSEGDIELEITHLPKIMVHADDKASCVIESLQPMNQSFVSIMSCAQDKYRIVGRKTMYQTIPVLNKNKSMGDSINDEDLGNLRIPSQTIHGSTILDSKQLIGMEAKRALRAQQPLKMSDIKKVYAIQKGDMIQVDYNQGGILLRLKTRALESGAIGDTIQVHGYQPSDGQVKQKPKIINAKVTGPGQGAII